MCSISSVQKVQGSCRLEELRGQIGVKEFHFFFLEVSMNVLVSVSWDVGLPHGAL